MLSSSQNYNLLYYFDLEGQRKKIRYSSRSLVIFEVNLIFSLNLLIFEIFEYVMHFVFNNHGCLYVFIFLLFQQWMIGEFASDKFTYIWLCQGCGIIAGAVVSGFLSDLVGRKTVLYVNLVMMSLAQGSLCILDDWVLFLISRGLVGIFAG